MLLRNPECTALGAAILAAVGSGHFAGLQEAVAAMVHVAAVVEPRAEFRALDDDLFSVVREAYAGLAASGWYGRLYEVQSRYF